MEFPSASDFHQTTSVPGLHRVLQVDPDLVCTVLRFRSSRLRFLPSFDRQDRGQRRYCLHGDVFLPGPESGSHLGCLSVSPLPLTSALDVIFSLVMLPSSWACTRVVPVARCASSRLRWVSSSGLGRPCVVSLRAYSSSFVTPPVPTLPSRLLQNSLSTAVLFIPSPSYPP